MSCARAFRSVAIAAIALAVSSPRAPAQEPEALSAASLTMEDLVSRMNRAESAVTARMRAFHPLVEVYIQNLSLDERLGPVPVKDEYFLGQFSWTDDRGPRLLPLRQEKGALRQNGNALVHAFSVQCLPDGFAAMAVPDWGLLDTEHYDFRFMKREFLGEARCYVLDVRPRANVHRDSLDVSGSRIVPITSSASTASISPPTPRSRVSFVRSSRFMSTAGASTSATDCGCRRTSIAKKPTRPSRARRFRGFPG